MREILTLEERRVRQEERQARRALFWANLRVAAEAGVLTGVRYGVTLLLVGAALLFLLSDYSTTKQNAAFAAGYIQKVIQQQQQAQAPAAPTQGPRP